MKTVSLIPMCISGQQNSTQKLVVGRTTKIKNLVVLKIILVVLILLPYYMYVVLVLILLFLLVRER